MRVLILSALFACASAAPSGLGPVVGPVVAPVVTPLVAKVAPVVIPGVPVAPVNSGDLQAALIDAKVQTEDLLRSVADKQRQVVEQAVVDTNEKVIEANDQVQEKAVESFWADQERKWQAFDAVQTAQAQLDGKIASESDAVAKSLVVPGVTVVAPYSPYVVAPGIIAPGVKAALPEAPKAEEPKPEEAKSDEKSEEAKSDSVQVESASVKTADVEKVNEAVNVKYVVGQTPLLASFPLSPLGLAPQPWAPAVAYQAHVIAPAVLKSVW